MGLFSTSKHLWKVKDPVTFMLNHTRGTVSEKDMQMATNVSAN
jgi:hypothetical protein